MGDLLKQSFLLMLKRRGFDSASVLSFTTLFAIVPILALIFIIFSVTPYFSELQKTLENFFFQQLLPKNYELVTTYMNQFVMSAQNLKGVSLLFLLPTTILLFYEIDSRINAICGHQKTRHLGIDLFIYLSVLVLAPMLLAGSLFISSYLSASKLFVFVPMGGVLMSGLPIILSALGLSLLYYFVPNSKFSFKNSLKAGFLVAILLEVLKSAIFIYITYFPVYELIYGALSAVLLFMLWIYCSWALVLFGASFNVLLHTDKTSPELS